MNLLGRHILAEFYACEAEKVNDASTVQQHLERAAELAGATVISSDMHRFEPHGLSGVLVLKESHMTIHTWPEHAYAAVDIFTCGCTIDPRAALDYLCREFGARRHAYVEVERGNRATFPELRVIERGANAPGVEANSKEGKAQPGA